jgi:hypothetical protein
VIVSTEVRTPDVNMLVKLITYYYLSTHSTFHPRGLNNHSLINGRSRLVFSESHCSDGFIQPVSNPECLDRQQARRRIKSLDSTYVERIFTRTKLSDQNQWDGSTIDEQLKPSRQLTKLEFPVKDELVKHALAFSFAMTFCGGFLGPFLDHFHSEFGVLSYDTPIKLSLWSEDHDRPALITAWWVPELFGLAGFIIGWLTIFLEYSLSTRVADSLLSKHNQKVVNSPTFPQIFLGVSLFIFQYWLSGFLYASQWDRSTILYVMSFICTTGFLIFNRSLVNFLTGLATAIGGPLIEVGLISYLPAASGYHYSDLGETGFFPLWIVPSTCSVNLYSSFFLLQPM